MIKYDFFVGGKWRNHENIRKFLDVLSENDKTYYCFIDNSYNNDGIEIDSKQPSEVENFMKNLETIEDWRSNPTYRQIFENDMAGIRESKEVIIIFPAGPSVHMEIGAAYGMGKKCYAIGFPEKYETLYLMFEEMFPTVEAFVESKLLKSPKKA